MIVELADYRDPSVRYRFDAEAHEVVSTHRVPSGVGMAGAVGFAALRALSLVPGRKKSFVAAGVVAGRLRLFLGTREFDCAGGALHVQRKMIFPFVRTCAIVVRERVELRFLYFYLGTDTFPDDGDIFSYMARMTRSLGSIVNFTRIWVASGEGRDVGSAEFLASLESASSQSKDT